MAIIRLTGWRKGLEKVSLSYLQMNTLGVGLKEAKENVDALLRDEPVLLQVENAEVALAFHTQATRIGVICTIEGL